MDSKKNLVLLALAITAFLNGVATQYFEPGVAFAKTDIWFMLTGTILTFTWYYLDSEQNNYKRGKLLNTSVIALGIVALPYYFFRTRGFKKGLIYTFLFLLVILLWSALEAGGAYAVYYSIQS